MKKRIIIHPSIIWGTTEKCCATCANWGKQFKNSTRAYKPHGYKKNGVTFRECREIGHISRENCVCDFFLKKTS